MQEKKLVTYESINMERVNAMVERYQKGTVAISRAEVVLTEACNFKCIYCKKRRDDVETEERIDKEVLIKNIKLWGQHGCKYIHFTGGEVSLIPYLPELVKAASESGIKNITMSTNGTGEPEFYEKLVRNGLNAVHLSLDTNNEQEFDSMVGIKGSFSKVINTCKTLTSLRDNEGFNVFLTMNTCVLPQTIAKLSSIVKFLLDLKPGDIKLMPISQLKEEWANYKEKYFNEVYPQIKSMIPHEGFNMLRSRIERLVDPSIRGYDLNKPKRCYLMREERTIDPKGNYYGCYINYRENGEAVGNIKTDSILEQSIKLDNKAAHLDTNEVCQKYCADITVLCNSLIEEKLLVG